MENLNYDPVSEILCIRDQIATMGANDSEISMINDILKKLNKGEINGKEAVKIALNIQNSKADYH